jgi:hypothetical protein
VNEQGKGSQPTSSESRSAVGGLDKSKSVPTGSSLLGNALLTAYVDQSVSGFSDDAVAATTEEIKLYADELRRRASEGARVDRAELVLQKHVTKAVEGLRVNREDDRAKILSDWAKRLGFVFLGLGIQQWNIVSNQANIDSGSVTWLVIDSVLATLLIVSGARMDKAFDWLFKRRS